MIVEKATTIQSSSILSENGLYRYKLVRKWDEFKPGATIVMLNPSKADMLITDRTIMNVTNFLVRNGYGSLSVVNLFAFRATDPKELKNRDDRFESLNDEYLTEAFNDAEVIIVAWTRDKFKSRKREVEKMLESFAGKIKCFSDSNGKKPRHPRDLGEDWLLVDYEFEHQKA